MHVGTAEQVKRCGVYTPSGTGMPQQPFGKDVANLQLFRALWKYAGLEELRFFLHHPAHPTEIVRQLGGGSESSTQVRATSIFNLAVAKECGTLLRGKADLGDLAWLRARARMGQDFSLVGLVHCLAPPAIRQYIVNTLLAPTHEWDAFICTSPVVRRCMTSLIDEAEEMIQSRFVGTGKLKGRPELPLIPLGVDTSSLAEARKDLGARKSVREEYGIDPDELLILWVGRLSYFEKAYPQPMFRAVEEAQQRASSRLHFIMAGWFPHEGDHAHYAAAAREFAPSTNVSFVDGTNGTLVRSLWAGADIFLSLVDNIQETFGLTPIEAMAAGLPVVASDWDGYRATIRDGVDGFLVPTLTNAKGGGELALSRHLLGMDPYQSYVGNLAQQTAVDVGAAAEALVRLANSTSLRNIMGQAAQQRAVDVFDWRMITGQLMSLLSELQQRRASAAPAHFAGADPIRAEPFGSFAEYATDTIHPEMVLSLRAASTASDIPRDALSRFGEAWRAAPEELDGIFACLTRKVECSIREVYELFPPQRHAAVTRTILWLCKLGILDWQQQRSGMRRFDHF